MLGMRRCGSMGQGVEIRDSLVLSWSDGLVRRKLGAGTPRSSLLFGQDEMNFGARGKQNVLSL
jgi:hypothetical protein